MKLVFWFIVYFATKLHRPCTATDTTGNSSESRQVDSNTWRESTPSCQAGMIGMDLSAAFAILILQKMAEEAFVWKIAWVSIRSRRAFCFNVSRQWKVVGVLVTCTIYKQQRDRDSVMQHRWAFDDRLHDKPMSPFLTQGQSWLALSHSSLHSFIDVCCWAFPIVASWNGLNLTRSLPWILDIYYHTLPCQCRRLLLCVCVSVHGAKPKQQSAERLLEVPKAGMQHAQHKPNVEKESI